MESILLKNINIDNLTDIDVYIKNGGYKSLEKALKTEPKEIINELKKSKITGRGGASFPTAIKWEGVRVEKSDIKYVICNADEGEPGTFKDRLLLRKNPHSLIEAMIIAAHTVGGNIGYIYIRGEYFEEIDIMDKAIKEATEKGYLGCNILGSHVNFTLQTFSGAGAYICGEETSLFESMQGNRYHPRNKPPLPTQSGVFGAPTIINNVETFCTIPHIIFKGGEWYSKLGSPESPGTKLFSISGHVKKRGVYEVETGITLKDFIEKYAGGMKGEFKAAIPGGISTALITDINTKLDKKGLMEAGSSMGSGAVIILNSDTDMVDVSKNTIDFFTHESCGQCTPCREGTRRAQQIINKIIKGEGKSKDLNLLKEMHETMVLTSLCGLGQSALNVTVSAIKHFENEFKAKIKE